MILLASTANAEQYFVLDVNHVIDYVTFNGISLREIDRPIKYSDKSGFMVKTVSFGNSDIKTIYYNMSENRNYLIYIPYDENAERIEVYNLKNSKIMDIDVSSFADTCGNSVCEEHESYESCTKDCKSGSADDFCDSVADGICDPDCSPKTDADCKGGEGNETAAAEITPIGEEAKENQFRRETEEEPNYLMWILMIFGVVIAALAFLFIKKQKEKHTTESLRQYISESIRRGFTLQQIKDALFREGYREKEIDKAVKAVGG